MPAGRDVVLPLGEFDSIDEAVRIAQQAEELGYGYVTMGETTGWNVALVLSVLAERTSDIGITDNVLSPYSRSPALLGQTAVTMQELTGDRFRLRLGASSPALAERWHGIDFDRPLRRLRESIEIIRQVQSGDRLDYDGECYSPGGLQLACPAPDPPAPVDVAALGPKSTEMTGRFADGWVPQLIPLDGLEARMADLERGADLGGRSVADIRVAHTLRCCAIGDVDRARAYARSQIAFMVAVYGPFYRQAIAAAGWESVTDDVHARWHDGDREGAVAAVPDELLDELVAVGTPGEAREQLRRFETVDGVDAIQIGFFGEMGPDDRQQTLEALAPKDPDAGS